MPTTELLGAPVTTRSAWAATSIAAGATALRTSGYAADGDGGAALYVRAASAPAHAGYFQSADGAYWVIAEHTLNFEMFGAAGNATAGSPTDDSTAIINCFAVANATAAKVRARPKWYYITQSIDLRNYASLDFEGSSHGQYIDPGTSTPQRQSTAFAMGANNLPIVRLALAAHFAHCYLYYVTQQTTLNTASIGLELNRLLGAQIDSVTVQGGYINIGIAQAAYAGIPGGTYASTGNPCYDSFGSNIRSYKASFAHYDLRNFNGGGTNLKISTLYANGGRVLGWGAAGQSCSYVIRSANWSGLEIGAISIDGIDCSVKMLDFQGNGVHINTLRFEEGQVTTDNAYWIHVEGAPSESLAIDYMELRNCRALVGNAATGQWLFRVDAGPVALKVGSIRFCGSNSSYTTPFFRILSYKVGLGLDSAIDLGPLFIDDASYPNFTPGSTNYIYNEDSYYQRPAVRNFCGRRVSELIQGGKNPSSNNPAYVRYADYNNDGTAGSGATNILYPTTAGEAAWTTGDLIVVTGFLATGVVNRWVCTGGGAPGSWSASERCGWMVPSAALSGDANGTYLPATMSNHMTQNTPLTADRTVTLSTTRAFAGLVVRFYRTAASTGAFNWIIGGLYNLATGQWCEVRYDVGSAAWVRHTAPQSV